MDLMNGQSSSVNIAATASEVRVTKLSNWILKTTNTHLKKNKSTKMKVFSFSRFGAADSWFVSWFHMPQFRCESQVLTFV